MPSSNHSPNQQSDSSAIPTSSKTSASELGRSDVYHDNDELFQDHFLQQYQTYVEMADRISSRRHATNVFFLTLQSTVITVLGYAIISENKMLINDPIWVGSIILFTMMMFCMAWWLLLRSYRNLNSAKYKVIGKMEASLPSSPYWKEEWKELGEGKDIRKYLPLSVIEQFLPLLFMLIYAVAWAFIYN